MKNVSGVINNVNEKFQRLRTAREMILQDAEDKKMCFFFI